MAGWVVKCFVLYGGWMTSLDVKRKEVEGICCGVPEAVKFCGACWGPSVSRPARMQGGVGARVPSGRGTPTSPGKPREVPPPTPNQICLRCPPNLAFPRMIFDIAFFWGEGEIIYSRP